MATPSLLRFRLLLGYLETSAESKMQVDARDELFCLCAKTRYLCALYRKPLLFDGTSVCAADALSRLREIERARLFVRGLRERCDAAGERLTGSERVLNIRNRAQGDTRIVRHGFLLFQGSD